MDDQSSSKNILQNNIHKAESQLDINYSPFSQDGFSVLKEKISDHIVQLVEESIKVSKRFQVDTISAEHVRIASLYLIAKKGSKFYRNIGTLGGILFGAALSSILPIFSGVNYSEVGIMLLFLMAIIGTLFMMLGALKD